MGVTKNHIQKLRRRAAQRAGQGGEGVAPVARGRGSKPGVGAAAKPALPAENRKALNGRGLTRDREMEQLRRELTRVTWELEFLREAAAFFVKTTRSGVR
jgi:transposase